VAEIVGADREIPPPADAYGRTDPDRVFQQMPTDNISRERHLRLKAYLFHISRRNCNRDSWKMLSKRRRRRCESKKVEMKER
jgi:hypothetical protein